MELPRIDIEGAFSRCVEALGGRVLDRELGGSRPFKNADYWFPRDQVVAELKVLSEDIFQKDGFIREATELCARWTREGKVMPLPPGRSMIRSDGLPPECTRELLSRLRAKLESSTIKNANTQIKETKQHLKVPDAVGVLIVANDGNFAFKPDVLFHLLRQSLRDRYRSIDALIFFTANEPLTFPGFGQKGAHLWTDLVVRGRRVLPAGFSNKLSAAWSQRYSELISGIVFEFRPQKPTPEEVGRLDFVNNPIRPKP